MQKMGILGFCLLLALGCATSGGGSETAAPLFHGRGTASSAVGAMAEAKREVLRRVIPQMIGEISAAANAEILSQIYYTTPSPDMFLLPETIITLSQGKSGDSFYYALSVRVNLDALGASLRTNGVFGQSVHPDGRAILLPDQPMPDFSSEPITPVGQAASNAGTLEEEPSDPSLTPEEERFIRRYVDKMTFMVLFDEENQTDPEYQNATISMANAYLTDKGLEIIDEASINQLKAEQRNAYAEQTGEAVDYIHWLAMNLNADVYITLDAVISGESDSGKHYGKVNLTMKFYEASTGRLLSSQPYNSPQTFSTSSQKDAVINALQSSVYSAMEPAMAKVNGYMRKALQNGIKYTLILQNTEDTRMISTFRRKLKPRLKDLQTDSQSPQETRYSLFFLGSVEDLQDLIFEVSENIEGMENLDLVYMRGKSLTFETGL